MRKVSKTSVIKITSKKVNRLQLKKVLEDIDDIILNRIDKIDIKLLNL